MSECSHMVTDNRIGPNFGKPLVHRDCSADLAAARQEIAALEARAEAAERENEDLRAIEAMCRQAADSWRDRAERAEREYVEREQRYKAATDRQVDTFKRLVGEKVESRDQLAAQTARTEALRAALQSIRSKANVGPFSPPRAGDPPWYNALVKVGKMAEDALKLSGQVSEASRAHEPMASWMTHVLGIVKDRRIPSADVIEDGEAILKLAASHPGPATEALCASCGEGKAKHITICTKNSKMSTQPNVSAATGGFAAMALRESYEDGNTSEVPSLGISFKKQPDDPRSAPAAAPELIADHPFAAWHLTDPSISDICATCSELRGRHAPAAEACDE